MVDALTEARALLLLQALPGMDDHAVERLVEAFGTGEGALAAPAADFADRVGPRAEAARRAPGELARRV